MGRGGEGSGGVGRAWVGGATRSSVISHPEIPFAPAGRDRAREVFRGGAAETPVCVYIALVVCTVGQSTAFSTRANLPGERLFFIYASRFHQKNAVQVAQNAPHAPSRPPFSAPSRSLAPPVKTAACHTTRLLSLVTTSSRALGDEPLERQHGDGGARERGRRACEGPGEAELRNR